MTSLILANIVYLEQNDGLVNWIVVGAEGDLTTNSLLGVANVEALDSVLDGFFCWVATTNC